MCWRKKHDSELQGTLSQLTTTLALLITSLQKTGVTMTTAIDKLTAELSKLAQTESALAAAIQADIAARQADAAKINELTDALAAANAANDEAAIENLIQQFDAISDKLSADAETLAGAIPPAQT